MAIEETERRLKQRGALETFFSCLSDEVPVVLLAYRLLFVL